MSSNLNIWENIVFIFGKLDCFNFWNRRVNNSNFENRIAKSYSQKYLNKQAPFADYFIKKCKLGDRSSSENRRLNSIELIAWRWFKPMIERRPSSGQRCPLTNRSFLEERQNVLTMPLMLLLTSKRVFQPLTSSKRMKNENYKYKFGGCIHPFVIVVGLMRNFATWFFTYRQILLELFIFRIWIYVWKLQM